MSQPVKIIFTALSGAMLAWVIFLGTYIISPGATLALYEISDMVRLCFIYVIKDAPYPDTHIVTLSQKCLNSLTIDIDFLAGIRANGSLFLWAHYTHYEAWKCFDILIRLVLAYAWHTILNFGWFYPNLEVLATVNIESKSRNIYDAKAAFLIWSQTMSLGTLAIWARGVGPRFRPDQLSDLTWKDLIVILFGFLCLAMFIMQ